MDELQNTKGNDFTILSGEATGSGKPTPRLILTINGGSSSLKFAIFDGANAGRLLSGRIDRIGLKNSRWYLSRNGSPNEDRSVDAPDQKSAVALLIDSIERSIGFSRVEAIGHRIVHGGIRYRQPKPITDEVIDHLRILCLCDPTHLPGEIALIEAFQNHSPSIRQVACFDTAFHHDMPRVAQIVPIPRRFETAGIRRYGFHGLSYQFLLEELAKLGSPAEANGRVILAHLGAGASLAAVRDGHSVDTTMGFTPASGLVMGTRTGDLDPGLVRFLTLTAGISVDDFDRMVNQESGLLGISEASSDVRDLLTQEGADVRAAEAINLFCYQAKKGIGALAAVLSGIQSLVFAGGIGENSPEIRRRICEGLEFLGIVLDDSRNKRSEILISASESPVKVRVIRTDEELMIAKSVFRTLGANTQEGF